MEAKKVRIDMVTLHPMPSESELDIFTSTYIYVQINKVLTLLMTTLYMGPDEFLVRLP